MALNALLDRNLVAQRYGKSEGTINNWVHLKKIPYIKIGNKALFDVKDLELWEKSRKIEPVVVKKLQAHK